MGPYKTRQELQDEVMELQKRIAYLEAEVAKERKAEDPRSPSHECPQAIEPTDADFWKRAVDSIPVSVMFVGLDFRITWMNASMGQLWGIDPQEAVGRPCYQVVHGQDTRPDWCPHARTLADGRPHAAIANEPRLGRTIAFRTCVLRDQGEIVGAAHVLIDLTEQTRAESALVESEERFRSLLNGMNEGFGIQDASGVITYVNDKLCTMWGYSREDLIGRLVEDFLDEKNKQVMREQLSLRRSGEIAAYELEWKGKGGLRIPTLMSPKAMLSSQGTYLGSFAVITDLTELKKAENDLKESEERYKNLVDLSPNGIHVHIDGRIVFANAAMAVLLGVPDPEDMVGTEVLDFIHPEFRDVVTQRIRTVTDQSEPVPLIEEKYIRSDGTVVDVEVAAAPLIFRGQPACQVVVRDIGDRKQAERQIRSSLKEKEILLREIHHRVKNNLQMISSLLKLEARYIGGKTMAEVLEESQVRIASMALVHEALYQSKNLASVDVGSYVEKLANYLFLSFGASRNKVQVNLQAEGIEIPLDKAVPCGLIINELVSNCLKHAFVGRSTGTIGITVSSDPKSVLLVVSDDGIGLPSHASVDEPQTMGLRLVRLLVKQLVGELQVTTGEGTEFRIRFRKRGPRRAMHSV